MRQSARRLRDMIIRKPLNTDSQKFAWSDEKEIRIKGVIQPFGPTTTGGALHVLAQQYGERIQFMKILFYTGEHRIAHRDGICLDVPGDASCDYRVVTVMEMPSYQQAVIEFIPEGRRA